MRNDYLIQEILNDPTFDIREDGSIWRRNQMTGNHYYSDPSYPLRRVDRLYETIRYWGVPYKGKTISVHRIIYARFNGMLKEGLEINHIDGNKANNHPSNLEQISVKENNVHAVMNGLKATSTKLTLHEVRDIKILLNIGIGYTEVSRMCGVERTSVEGIKRRISWAHFDISHPLD